LQEDTAASSGLSAPRNWAGKVDGLTGTRTSARQRKQQKAEQQIHLEARRGSHQQHNAPIRSSQWQEHPASRPGGGGGGISERIVRRQLDDLCREFISAGQATVEDVWEQCGRCYPTSRSHLRLLTGADASQEQEAHGAAYDGGHRYEYRYRDEGFAEDSEEDEEGGGHGDEEEEYWNKEMPSRGPSTRGAARRKRLKAEWQTVEKNPRQRMVFDQGGDALEDRIMAEMGGAGVAGQDVLEMVRYKELQWRQEVRMAASCMAAGNMVEANKHKEKAQRMAKFVELLQKVARRRTLQEHNCRNVEGDLPKIDLHGLYVHQAIEEVEAFMRRLAPGAGEETGKFYALIIVGAGHHSEGGIAKIKPEVKKWLQDRGVKFGVQNIGCFWVDLGTFKP
jgi:DNA-nicking Smr family endonuclease